MTILAGRSQGTETQGLGLGPRHFDSQGGRCPRETCFFPWALFILVWVCLFGCSSCFMRVGVLVGLVSVGVFVSRRSLGSLGRVSSSLSGFRVVRGHSRGVSQHKRAKASRAAAFPSPVAVTEASLLSPRPGFPWRPWRRCCARASTGSGCGCCGSRAPGLPWKTPGLTTTASAC